jgi:hypothetical protein
VADPTKRVIVDGVDFRQVVRFPMILKAIPAALQPPRLLIGLVVVLLLISVGRAWDSFTEPRVHPAGLTAGELTVAEQTATQQVLREAMRRYVPADRHPVQEEDAVWPRLDAHQVFREVQRGYRRQRDPAVGIDELHARDQRFFDTLRRIDEVRPKYTFESVSSHTAGSVHTIVRGVIHLSPAAIFEGFADLFIHMPIALWRDHKAFTILYGLFTLLLIAIGGGAVSRMAACDIAGQHRLRMIEAWQFALLNWPRLVLAPLFPPLLAAVIALVIMLLGVIMQIPALDIIGGLLYGLALLLGFIVAFLILGYAVSFPLLVPAVACENCDAADAQQRAYAYVLSRPLHVLGYGITGVIGLALGYVLVAFVTATVLNFTAGLFGALTGNTAMSIAGGFGLFDLDQRFAPEIHGRWHNATAAWFIGLWQTLMIALVAAYVFAYAFSASTMGYLLMRKACDGQDIEEIWVPGLVPGTLAPMPRTRVEHAERGGDEAAGGGP